MTVRKRRLVSSYAGEATVRTMAMPADANWMGDIFGGWIMSHADIAGAILAYRRAGGKVVTVAVKDFQFMEPVYVGDILTFFSKVTRVGNTSLAIEVKVYAERPGASPGEHLKVALGTYTYVHVDDDGKPKQVPADDDKPRPANT